MKWICFILATGFWSTQVSAQHCDLGRYGTEEVFSADEVVKHSNLPFAQAQNLFSGNLQSLELDIWEPDPAIDSEVIRPLVVWVHGGSFMGGSRQEMNYFCEEFAKRGFVTATVSYRLGWDCDPNAGIFTCAVCGSQSSKLLTAAYCSSQDVRAGLRYLVNNAEEYGIDPNWIFLGGVSAGSISALSVAFMDQLDADALLPNAVLQAGPLNSSGNELTDTYEIKGVINDCGAVFNTSVIGEDDRIPVISFHDEGDCVVPYGNGRVLSCLGCAAFPTASGSSQIHNRLMQMDVCSELNTLQLSLLHCGWPSGNIVKRSACFLKRIMCGVCTSGDNNNVAASSPCGNLSLPDPNDDSCVADINTDGIIGTGDLIILLAAFGNICP